MFSRPSPEPGAPLAAPDEQTELKMGQATPMSMPGLTRQNLADYTTDVVRAGGEVRPEVRSVRVGGSELVVKDYRSGKSLFGRLLGRFLIWREKIAYEWLEGLPGVPHYYGTIDPYALVLQHVPGRHASAVPADQIPVDFFDQLSELVRSLHDRGIAHADLHKLDNILIDENGQPVLVDFTSAVMLGSNPLAALLFPVLCDDDWRGVYKLKREIAPERLTDEERDFLEQRSLYERIFRRIREPFRALIRRWSAC